MSERISGCVFCADLDQIVYQSDDLFVLPDIAPLVDGHALICARAHYPSVADLPAPLAAELDRLNDRVRALYLREFGAYAMFEHGRTGHCLRRRPEERICHHMHVHVLPLPGDLVAAAGLGQRIRSDTWQEIVELGRDTDGYAVVESVDAGRWFFPVTHDLAPHYLRSRAADLLGDPTLADWAERVDTGVDPDRAARNRERLRALLAEVPLAPVQ